MNRFKTRFADQAHFQETDIRATTHNKHAELHRARHQRKPRVSHDEIAAVHHEVRVEIPDPVHGVVSGGGSDGRFRGQPARASEEHSRHDVSVDG